MSESPRCPKCGIQLPADAPAGLCPKCLVQAGFESQPASQPGPTVLTPPSSGFAPPTVEELAPLFPQLDILELLGKGGMGAVYKARQPGLDRLVALKILPPEISHDPAFAERFQREARALARLSHPHIVAVYDFGTTEANGGRQPPGAVSRQFHQGADAPRSPSLCYIVMEFVDGANLRQTIQAGKLAAAEALAIVPQICEALQFAHDEGIVHRDIKPENILIDKRGRVKIADFGLAKLLGADASDHSLTATHQVMGTLRYMAPEQMQGSREVDHRADIYSLGVVFYELLTGELPMGRFAPPSKRVQVDVRLDEIVLRALEREPEQRYQHASELKSAVTSFSAVADRTPMTPGDQDRDQSRNRTTQVHKLLDVTETRNRRLHQHLTGIGFVSLLIAFYLGLASTAKTLTGYRSILLCTCALAMLAGIAFMVYSARIKRRLCWKVDYKGHTIVFDGGRPFAERLYLDDGLVRQGGFGSKMEIRTTIKAGDGIGDEIVVWYDARIRSCRCRIEVEEKSWGEQTVGVARQESSMGVAIPARPASRPSDDSGRAILPSEPHVYGSLTYFVVVLSVLALVGLAMWFGQSAWWLLGLLVPETMIAALTRPDELRTLGGRLRLLIIVLAILGLIAFGMWLEQSPWPLLALVLFSVPIVAASDKDEDETPEKEATGTGPVSSPRPESAKDVATPARHEPRESTGTEEVQHPSATSEPRLSRFAKTLFPAKQPEAATQGTNSDQNSAVGNPSNGLGRISLWAAISGVVVPALLLIGGIVMSSRVSIPDGFVLACFILGVGLELVAVGCGSTSRSTTPGKAGLITGSIALLLWLATLAMIPTRVSTREGQPDSFTESGSLRTSDVSSADVPPLGTISSGIGAEFIVPAGQVATFEVVTRHNNSTVPVPPHCGYVMAPSDRDVAGTFRWSRKPVDPADGEPSREWSLEIRSSGGSGYTEGTLVPEELNKSVGAMKLGLGHLAPNEEVIHWGTADANNLPSNGLIGLRVTVVTHGMKTGGSGNAHIDWKKSQSATSTTRRKLTDDSP